ncbi:methyl-accepting chemotaxis protein [Fischerella thermalis]|uniref:methyl-accepting chemotaxis protein n=1 Tax=Fischerella thermalis TaxID=372787 RepID=UPI000C7FF2B0|nr:methyl-accepting chemotaxis protein [Fischerella thermalis]PLZ04714.1 chemotaxis protein [Fischerella thermalis WC114]PLZ05451.1 chemotaxis protein [Fischerella thermalis WC1110]PLZ16404.1 chemotaxis protein [Fischerella thermalis WC157]PLZ41718.1 chemotaxis protein [Fischerella thermalis WC538]PLZ42082.1 chemotaxis protein [Fischerella thermalis WC527]
MFNKTDAANSSDIENRKSMLPSQKVKDSVVKLPDLPNNDQTETISPLNRIFASFKRLSLGTKATVLAIAIGTLPVLGIGVLAYQITKNSVQNKASQLQQSQAEDLADKVNRFMVERYGDIQFISNLPMLADPQIRANTSPQEKQAILDRIIETRIVDGSRIYESIAVYDLKGDLLIQSQGKATPNVKDSTFFKTVQQSDRPYISQPEVSPATNKFSIYIAAPVKENGTGNTIAIARVLMPVKPLEDLARSYTKTVEEYFFLDNSGKIFIASEPDHVNSNIKTDYPDVYKSLQKFREQTVVGLDPVHGDRRQLLSYVPVKPLKGLPDLQWEILLATNTSTAFAAQQELLLTFAIGTGLTAIIVAAIAAWIAKRATEPILEATATVEKLGRGELNTRLYFQGEDELGVLVANINQMAAQLEASLKEQEQDAERAKLLADITLRLRRSLKEDDIYKTTVREVRQALKTDRVIVYKFHTDTWDGAVVAEAVSSSFPKMLGVQIDDPCFRERHVNAYKDGRVRAITNIYQDPNLSNPDCYIKMLERFAVKANLIAPIVHQEELVALLIAHHCDSPRIWQQTEIDLFKQIATQVGYALEQAKLLQELESAKVIAEKSTIDERQQKEALQMQLLELLSNVEGAASGDLTVRADVTAGEIGTVADFFNSIVESLRDIVTQVKVAANQVNQAIGTNSGAIHQLAEEALAQAAEIDHTLNAVDQMTASIQAVADSAQQAAIIAQNASTTAAKSSQAMDMTVQNILHLRETVGETAKKVKRLGESTQQISRVVALINQISMQTNLLAINAGIEAARAGEEGQGFAIVAEEVGELAARSAAATKEIEQIVENIQRETSEVVQAMEVGTAQVVEGTRIVEEAKGSLSQILEVSRQIDALVQSISTTTASGVETSQIVSELMKQIAIISKRTSDSSLQVSESLQQTVKISQKLQETVGTFKVN